MDVDRIDAAVRDVVPSDGPGVAVGVVREKELVLARGYGLASLEHQVPVAAATVFDIGSTSKQFTAACVVVAAELGLLSLDDSVRRAIPELPEDPYGPVTLRQLMHHTGGVQDYIGLLVLSGRPMHNDVPEDAVVDLIARQTELCFAPGTGFSYSNSGYFLLGEAVARTAGTSLRAFAQEHLFAPAEMKSTAYHDDFTEVVPGRASAYHNTPNGPALDVPLLDLVGDGGVLTTVEDLAAWVRWLGEPGPVADAQVRSDATGPGYAAGVFVDDYRGLQRIHHAGAWGAYRSQLVRFPTLDAGVIVLANASDVPVVALADTVTDLVLGDTLGPPATTPRPPIDAPADAARPAPRAVRRGVTGRYRSSELDASLILTAEGDQLRARIGWLPWESLEPVTELTYQGGGIEWDCDGSTVVLRAPRMRPQVFTREAEEA